jgi:hypothetical protein
VTGRPCRQLARRSRSRILPRSVVNAFVGFVTIAGSLTRCAPAADQPMKGPVETMEAPWGPFARQCATTRVSHMTQRWRRGDVEVGDNYQTCMGFSAMPSGHDAAEITASVGNPDRPPSTVILRILRQAGGATRKAASGDTGLLAQGSDVPEAAQVLARDIGLTSPQLISPNETLELPVQLLIPFPLETVLSCRPDGGHRDHGRDTLVFSCRSNQKVHTDRLDAQVQLAGVEQIDIQSGVRLSSVLAGHLSGRSRSGDNAAWLSANNRLLYRREMEFE